MPAIYFKTNDPHAPPTGIACLTCCCLCGGRLKLTIAVLLTAIIYSIFTITELVLGAAALLKGALAIGPIVVILSVLRLLSIGYWIAKSRTTLANNQSMSVANGLFQVFGVCAVFGIGFCTQTPTIDVNNALKNTDLQSPFMLVLFIDFLFTLFYGYPVVHLVRSHNFALDHPPPRSELDDWANRH